MFQEIIAGGQLHLPADSTKTHVDEGNKVNQLMWRRIRGRETHNESENREQRIKQKLGFT